MKFSKKENAKILSNAPLNELSATEATLSYHSTSGESVKD